jgi:hypothetical protein
MNTSAAAEGIFSDPDGERKFTCRRCNHPHRVSRGALGVLLLAAFADSCTGQTVPPVTLAGAHDWVSVPCDTTTAPSGNGRLWQRCA